ncbi:hypothetical protein G7Z17_g13022 [Cylindrodendrum hubeiense]|uniref:Involucrin repeat protein n=1 Tax=Cylindrodendrum hubeiense TaxID=595255 RepID=A0A9P5GUE6_9HYPO|nr:hypothetical protein G7Z17_g13022 [Cylindrodendrum hubeiense]
MAGQQIVTGSSQPIQPTTDVAVNPFQYQVADDAFMIPKLNTPQRPLTPTVVTVDREPNFDDSPPRTSAADARLSRKDSYEIEKMVEDYRQGNQDASRYKDPREGHEYEEEEHQARSIFDQAKHATIPVAAAAFASAIAVEEERSREQRKGKSSEDSSRDSSRPRDVVQDEADKYYRESVIARKIASDEMRSRSTSPEPSVVDKWRDTSIETITIVTPPDLEDKEPKTSRYDGPNADVRIDNKIFPHEESRFRSSSRDLDAPTFQSRDPSAERERPLLNLVYPTPVPSREPSPIPDEREITREVEESTSNSEVDIITIGPKGEVIHGTPTAKSVSWGENETKSFEVESPEGRSDSEGYVRSENSDKPRPRLNKASRWGAIAAAMAVSSKEPINEPDVELPSAKDSELTRSSPDEARDVPVHSAQIYADDASQEPPVPGPKPTSPRTEYMPGGYADDIEFAATLAAGLKDTGFNPDMVIEDPTYARRESPPGVQDANGDSWYKTPYSETVPDFTGIPASKQAPDSGFILGEVETPQESTSAPTDSEREQPFDYLAETQPSETPGSPSDEVAARVDDVSPQRPSKREQRKRDKVVVVQDDETSRVIDPEPVQPREVGETYWEDVGRHRSKKHHISRDYDDGEGSRVSAPIESHHDRHSAREYSSRDVRSDDEWDAPKHDRRDDPKHDKRDAPKHDKRRRDSDTGDLSRFVAPAAALGALALAGHHLAKDNRSRSRSRESRRHNERDISRKSKHKRSRDVDDWDASQVSAPVESSHRRRSSRNVPSRDVQSDDEWDAPRSSKRHSRDRDYYNEDGSRVQALVGEYERHSSRNSPSRESPSRDRISDDEWDTPKKSSRSRSKRDSATYDSPTRSVAPSEISVRSSSSRRSKKDKRRSGTEEDFYGPRDSPTDRRRDHFDDRDVSSVVSESRGDDRHREGGHRRSKSSRFDDDDVKSVVSAPGSGSSRRSRDHKDRRDPEKRSSGVFSSIFKSSSHKDGKRDSFLDNADTLGAGVGLAGAVAAAARFNASEPLSDEEHEAYSDIRRIRSFDTFDPEVAPRAIKPAIDPQYGDLLPLPPSEPGSPYSSPGELPSLPDSRPDTPPELRAFKHEVLTHQRRRSHDIPTKTPSHTAIPIQLRLGNRSSPQSPIGYRSSPPAGSPVVTTADYSPSSSRRGIRPTSWDSSREFKPLYLLEQSRNIPPLDEAELPELPPSEASERDSPEPETHRRNDYFGPSLHDIHFADPGLQIDTSIPPTARSDEDAGSGESTPRAEFRPEFPFLAPMETTAPEYSRELVLTDEPHMGISQEPLIQGPELYHPVPTFMDAAVPEYSHERVLIEEPPMNVSYEPLLKGLELAPAPVETSEPESSRELDEPPMDVPQEPELPALAPIEVIEPESSRKPDELPVDTPQESSTEGPEPELPAPAPIEVIEPESSAPAPIGTVEPESARELVLTDEPPMDAPPNPEPEWSKPEPAAASKGGWGSSLFNFRTPSLRTALLNFTPPSLRTAETTPTRQSVPDDGIDGLTSADEDLSDASDGYLEDQVPKAPAYTLREVPSAEQQFANEATLHRIVDEVVPEVTSKATTEAVPKSIVEPVVEPATELATEPVVEEITRETTPKPVEPTEPRVEAVEIVKEPTRADISRELVSELIAEPVPDIPTELSDEPLTVELPREIPEPIIEPTIEAKIPEPIVEPIVEAIPDIPKVLNDEPVAEELSREIIPEPTVEAIIEPTVEAIPDIPTIIGDEPLTEELSREIPEPIVEPIVEAIPNIPTVLSDESVTEELSREIIPEPVIEAVSQPGSEPPIEPTSELVTEPVRELAAEVALEASVEPPTEPVSELVTEPASEPIPEAVAEGDIEPPAVPVSETAEVAVEPATEPTTETATKPAENEYTKEAWESIPGKERKKIRKNLKKIGLELVLIDSVPAPASTSAPVEEDPREVETPKDEEVISVEEPGLKDESTELEKTEEKPTAAVEEPVEVLPESDALEKDITTTPEHEGPLPKALEDTSPSEQEPDTLATDRSLDAIVESEMVTPSSDPQGPETTPSETLPTEDVVEASREPSTDVAEVDTSQTQPKKSKKKKKGKAAAAMEDKPVHTEPVAVDVKSSFDDLPPSEQEPDTVDAERRVDAIIEPEMVTSSSDSQGPVTIPSETLPTEDTVEASRELSTDVAEVDTSQPQPKKSKKKKKKSKAAAAMEDEPVHTEPMCTCPRN